MNRQAPPVQDPDIAQLLQRFGAATRPERRQLVLQLRSLLPRDPTPVARDRWYRDAIRHAPRVARRLDGMLAEHAEIAAAVLQVDLEDADEVERVVNELAAQERREASLLAEIWYDEVGGEG